MSTMQRQNQQFQCNMLDQLSDYAPATSNTSQSSDFFSKTKDPGASRRSIDWRDSGIVIDDDYQFNFATFDRLASEQSIESSQPKRTSTIADEFKQSKSIESLSHNAQFHTDLLECQSQIQSYPPQKIAADEDGDTILHLAVVGFTKQKVQDLIKIGNVNFMNNMMQTPLHVAILANRPEIVELLVNHEDIKLDCFDRRGNAPIHLACQNGNREIVEILLNSIKLKGPDQEVTQLRLRNLIEMTNFDGQTCLHLAALNDRRDVIKLLVLKFGADINYPDSKSGETILHMSICKLNVELVRLILDLSDRPDNLGQRHINRLDFAGRGPVDKTRMMLESRSLDAHEQIDKLNQIGQMLAQRVKVCADLGCHHCSSAKIERSLKLINDSQGGILINDELGSSTSMSNSESSDSDYDMD